jgi:hypothetical protein
MLLPNTAEANSAERFVYLCVDSLMIQSFLECMAPPIFLALGEELAELRFAVQRTLLLRASPSTEMRATKAPLRR